MRIAGINIPEQKRLEIALTVIHGIGRQRAKTTLDGLKLDWGTKASDLTPEQENAVRKAIETYKIEGDLKRSKAQDIKRLKDISSYRGNRHAKHMPVRGQRTKTNSRTVRGNVRKTMSSGRRKAEKK